MPNLSKTLQRIAKNAPRQDINKPITKNGITIATDSYRAIITTEKIDGSVPDAPDNTVIFTYLDNMLDIGTDTIEVKVNPHYLRDLLDAFIAAAPAAVHEGVTLKISTLSTNSTPIILTHGLESVDMKGLLMPLTK